MFLPEGGCHLLCARRRYRGREEEKNKQRGREGQETEERRGGGGREGQSERRGKRTKGTGRERGKRERSSIEETCNTQTISILTI